MGWRRPRTGFTLIELLVVIAIIAVLAVLLWRPVHRVDRPTAHLAGCNGNLRRLNLAVQMYVEDHGGTFPLGLNGPSPGVEWWQVIEPYRQSAYRPSQPQEEDLTCPATEVRPSSYGWNGGLPDHAFRDGMGRAFWDAPPARQRVSWEMLPDPAETVVMGDISPSGGTWELRFDDLPAPHRRGLNLGFADGHVKLCKREALVAAPRLFSRTRD